MQKLRVGVLMGGKSQEAEVSFNSGRTICDHLDKNLYEVLPFFQTTAGTLYLLPWSFLYRGKIRDFEHRLDSQAQKFTWHHLKDQIDFAYIAMHGRFAEDGILQGVLEVLQIPYLGSKILASALGMDKRMHKPLLKAQSIRVPRDIVVQPSDNIDITTIIQRMQNNDFSFPCIVKPHKEGSSFGVSYVKEEGSLEAAVKRAMFVNQQPQSVLIEEYIAGMEFSCIVLYDAESNAWLALEPTEIVTSAQTFFDYEQKYMPGKSLQFTPARCVEKVRQQIKDICLAVTQILEFSTISRIDGIVTSDNEIVIIDPNSFSGAAPSSFLFKQAAQIGLNHSQLINHLIKTELHAYGIKPRMASQMKENMKNQKKARIAVLMGGDSNEREISLESGRNVTYKLSPHAYEVMPFFVTESLELYKMDATHLVCNSTKEVESHLNEHDRISWDALAQYADFVFLALHGGKGENGSVQGMLEMLELAYNGSPVLTSALCMNKFKTNMVLEQLGFDVPQNLLISREEWQKNKQQIIQRVKDQFNFLCIVKPHDDGCSMFVQKSFDENSFIAHMSVLFAHNKNYAFIEEYIDGVELTGGVVGNARPVALPPSCTVRSADILSIEEKFLPGAGENQTPAPLPEKSLNFIKSTLENVYKALDCKGYARIDCFYQVPNQSPTGKERVVILEINTLPALTPATCLFHQAAEIGLKPGEFLDLVIALGLEEHGKDGSNIPFAEFEGALAFLKENFFSEISL